jgi:Brp/Blh family beta-carotene 15,15'-monooxygenase
VREPQAGDVDRSDRRFHVRYVSAIVAVLGVWAVAPAAALALFLLISIHHFGQSDLAWCRLPARRQLPLQWSRGLLLVGLPLVAHPDAIGPTIELLGGGRPDQWPWLTDRALLWSAVLIAQHAAVGAVVVRRSGIDARWIRRETVGLALVVTVLVVTDPLVGFAVYFGLWHSLGHVLAVRQALADRSDPGSSMITWREFGRLALPRTLLSASGIVAVIVGCHVAGRPDDAVAALFVLVSAITVPHLVVVERMWTGAPAPVSTRS